MKRNRFGRGFARIAGVGTGSDRVYDGEKMGSHFIADFHVHSHYSRATSRDLVPEKIDFWARLKGVTVVGSGDFTHPGWKSELQEKLEPAEPGLFKLREACRYRDPRFSWADSLPVRFMLTGEVSSIYKKQGRVRKVHNLLFAPDFAAVEAIQSELLRRKANISSDGRPILGMDCHDLLELSLDASRGAVFFVPAHIWTPWFSVLGDHSGFASIAECFEDLTAHIRAVETGLSSDPPMNWLCRFLDPFTIISNSDAHSVEKIGREANLLGSELSWDGIIGAVRTGAAEKFLGTIEFFPQEGKYHFDGHRRCNVCLHPHEAVKNKGLCPVCGKPVTIGVLHRVMELCDRAAGEERSLRHPFHSLISLREVIAEILCVSPAAGKVEEFYFSLLKKMGPELAILMDIPLERIRSIAGDEVGEAIERMRCGKVFISEGYDGEYGRIRVFAEHELKGAPRQKKLFKEEPGATARPEVPTSESVSARLQPLERSAGSKPDVVENGRSEEANAVQLAAIGHFTGPALVIAGPGTGKTQVLAQRIAHLVSQRAVDPRNTMAVTFTNKAAREMRERVARLLPGHRGVAELAVSTFHSFGLQVLRAHTDAGNRRPGFAILDEDERRFVLTTVAEAATISADVAVDAISQAKQTLPDPARMEASGLRQLFENYERRLEELNAYDIDDLIAATCTLFERHPQIAAAYRWDLRFILVDECQDMNESQYRLLKLIQPPADGNLFLIGDPHQAIYGFRGADAAIIERFLQEYSPIATYRLQRSYRCSDTILHASTQVIHGATAAKGNLIGVAPGVKIRLARCPTGKSEAEFIARKIEEMAGGLRFFSLDSKIANGEKESGIESLSDFAVLCRFGEQMRDLRQAFDHHGIPIQTVEDPPFFKKEPLKTLTAVLRWGSAASENAILGEALIKRLPTGRRILSHWDEIMAGLRARPAVRDKLIFLAEHHVSFDTEEQRGDLNRLLVTAETYGQDLDGFLKWIGLGIGADTHRPELESVSLMTIHAAKGLEFACVFIPACEEGVLPYSLFAASTREGDVSEERRLLYVGMTRAKSHLFLTHADKRILFGRDFALPRSRFLDPIEAALLENVSAPAHKKEPEGPRQLKLFDF